MRGSVLFLFFPLFLPATDASAQEGGLSVLDLEGRARVLTEWSLREGRLKGLALGVETVLPREDCWVLRGRTRIRSLPNPDAGPFYRLRGGLEVSARLRGGGRGFLRFEPDLLGKAQEVPLRFLEGLLCRPEGPLTEDAGFRKALADPPLKEDLCFYLAEGGDAKTSDGGKPRVKRIPCKVLGGKGAEILLEIGGRERSLPLARIYGLVFAESSGLEAVPDPDSPPDLLTLSDGRILRGRLLEGDSARGWRFRSLEGLEFRVPVNLSRDVELAGPKLRFLGDLPGFETEGGAALTRTWPLFRDRGPGGAPLALGRRVFRHGFWLVPPRRIRVSVAGKKGVLRATLGLVPSRFGGVRFRLLGDGGDLLPPRILDQERGPVELEVPIDGIGTLELVFECGTDLDAGSQVVLGDPRLCLQG